MRARLFHILTLFGSTAVAGPLGGADAESSGRWNQAPVERLVEYLAHERWETREAAERALLQRGMSAVEPLRSALSSENPELVRRVRYLLGRVDPTLGVFRVLRFELEPEPRVVEVAYYSGPPGENLVLRGERLVEPPDAAPRPSSDPRNARLRYASSRVSGRRTFRLSWWPLSDDEVEWTLQNATASRRGVSLPVLAPSGGIRLFEQGEESGYLRTGLVVDRQRQPYVVLVEQRLFRRSLNDALERPRDAAALRRTVVRALVEQGTRDHLDDRLAAIELVGLLRVEEGKELVERALDDPSTFPTAALSLAALRDPRGPALLRRVLREERALPEIRRRRQGNALRAAVELSRLGDADGLAFLVEELPKSDVFGLHALLSALVDRLPQIFDDDRLREDLLDVALNPDFLGRVSWNDPEVEYFLFRVLTSLDPDRPRDRMRAAGFQRGIERVASGEFPTARVSLARLRPLWSLAARAASETQESPDDETSLILAALAEGGRRRLSEVVREIRSVFADSPLPEPCFQRLLHRFRKALLSENPFEVTSAAQQLVELSKSLRLAAGQLRPWVELLVDWSSAEAPSRVDRANAQRLSSEMLRWTALGESAARRPGLVRTPASRSRPAGATTAHLRAVARQVEKWLADREKVAAREAEILSERQSAPPSGRRLVYYEFHLRRPGSPATGDSSAVRLLDGHRLEITAGEARTYHARWGSRRRVFLEPLSTAATAVRRYRLNGRATVTENVPLLLSGSSTGWTSQRFEISNLSPLGRSVSRTTAVVYQTLVFVTAPGEPPQEGARDDLPEPRGAGPESPEKLWQRFVEEQLLDVSGPLSSARLQATVRVLEQLRLPRTRVVLRRLLTKTGNPLMARRIAAVLHEMGDAAGTSYFIEKARDTASSEGFTCAETLCRLGVREGAEILMQHLESERAVRTVHKTRGLAALDRYLQSGSATRETERQIVEFVFRDLKKTWPASSSVTSHFRIIRRVAGRDFGHQEALRRRGSGRNEALGKAIDAALRWGHGGAGETRR